MNHYLVDMQDDRDLKRALDQEHQEGLINQSLDQLAPIFLQKSIKRYTHCN